MTDADWTNRKDLLEIVQTGRLEIESDILGNKVKLRLLTAEEEEDVRRASNGLDVFVKELADGREVMARATLTINDNSFKDLAEARRFYGKVNSDILAIFQTEYTKLKTTKRLEIQQLQDRIKKSSGNQEAGGSGESSE